MDENDDVELDEEEEEGGWTRTREPRSWRRTVRGKGAGRGRGDRYEEAEAKGLGKNYVEGGRNYFAAACRKVNKGVKSGDLKRDWCHQVNNMVRSRRMLRKTQLVKSNRSDYLYK